MDASVASDAKHNVWLVSSLTLLESGGVHGNAVVASRSTEGLTWSNPVTTATGGDLDKNWTVCDNTSTSPFTATATPNGTTTAAATGCR